MTMENNPDYLFVYGTLLDEDNPFAEFLQANSKFYATGKFTGELYNLGNYPGAVITAAGDDFVYGKVFKLDTNGTVLNELDEYEGYGDAFAQPNEFVRSVALIDTGDELINCWVYLYNHPVKPASRITSGRYR
jgi:gamma-glutamylcyclotransferase (GGCT)/AIG2-like uncharacterized protein YtfP